jgi:ParB family chromosome partitioning protein|tara:strand:+ start:10529 stop:11131 length:603 start_codon:yes stop_codon:yes gene_type:complete
MADDLKIKYVPTKHLEPYSGNSRAHSTDQIDQIVRSINEFGFTNPILLGDGNEVVAGHGRLQAALRLNLDFVPTITLEGLTETQKRAYVIADNKLALNATWDDDLLKIEIDLLLDSDFDIDILGWDSLPNFEGEVDYSILDDDDLDSQITDMTGGVKKAIMIEFEAEHYAEAKELVDYWRKEGAYVGRMIMTYLDDQKNK